jgi:hypothetical protein
MPLHFVPLSDGDLDLAAALAKREVIPFIGSGFSIEAFQQAALSDALPSWDGFVDKLVAMCGHAPLGEAKQIFSEAFPDLLQIVLDNTGTRAPVSKALQEIFIGGVPYTSVADMATLVKTMRKLAPPFVLTTNYDALLENIWDCPVLDLSTQLEEIRSLVEYRVSKSRSPRAIIKIHGTAGNALGATVTSTDYRRLFAENQIVQDLFSTLGLRYSFWFIGYSIRDIDVRWALFELQRTRAHRQHFRHEMQLLHPLQPRIEHIQQSVRLLELRPEGLSRRVERIYSAVGIFSGRANKFSVFSSDEKKFAELTRVLSRFEIPWSEDFGISLLGDWMSELEARTNSWVNPLESNDLWERFFTVERILRHFFFVRSQFTERTLIARYVLANLGEVPERFVLEAVGVIGEGLCYVDNEPKALGKARAALQRAKRATPGNEKSFALTRALIHRSEAKWAIRSKKRPLLRKAVVSAASAEAAEFQSACLLDLSKLAVDKLLAGQLCGLSEKERVDGILTARAALELALFGGSYRRADLALQRLAILDHGQAEHWLRTAGELREEKRLPAEPRNALYLALTKAIVRKRQQRHQEAVDLMAPYDAVWFAVNGLKQPDADFYSKVWNIVQ